MIRKGFTGKKFKPVLKDEEYSTIKKRILTGAMIQVTMKVGICSKKTNLYITGGFYYE